MKASTIRCVITAGPTREYLDPVRYFSNGSSGKMGYALAARALARGWATQLISGPVALTAPPGAELHRVVSAAEMLEATGRLFAECDVLIMCAAVADYRPVAMAREKMKKTGGRMTVELEPTVDILARLGACKSGQLLVGFAAETENLENHARRKMEAKNLDWIVGNQVGGTRSAMEGDENEIVLLGREGARRSFGPAPKIDVAEFILAALAEKLGDG